MTTQKFMGRGQLIDRLAAQVGSRDTALEILRKRGQVDDKGQLTDAGKKRDAMTAEERAIKRASTASGNRATLYKYNPRTNRATLKKR